MYCFIGHYTSMSMFTRPGPLIVVSIVYIFPGVLEVKYRFAKSPSGHINYGAIQTMAHHHYYYKVLGQINTLLKVCHHVEKSDHYISPKMCISQYSFHCMCIYTSIVLLYIQHTAINVIFSTQQCHMNLGYVCN